MEYILLQVIRIQVYLRINNNNICTPISLFDIFSFSKFDRSIQRLCLLAREGIVGKVAAQRLLVEERSVRAEECPVVRVDDIALIILYWKADVKELEGEKQRCHEELGVCLPKSIPLE